MENWIKEVVRDSRFGLVVLHIKDVLLDKTFTISKNYLERRKD